MPLVIGVAGGSGSGKTTIVRRLVDALGASAANVLAHDRYYRDHSRLTPEERARFNFDHPDALDTALLIEHVTRLRAGEPADLPVYDFRRHERTPQVERVEPRQTILIEGILVFADATLRSLMDIKVFVDTDDATRLQRRVARDTVERGRSIPSVVAQYTETVRPMFEAFVEPTRPYADLIVEQGGYNDVALATLLGMIRQRLG